MKLLFEILKATTKLEIGSTVHDGTGLPAERLRALMQEVATDLHQAVEEASPLWGELTGTIKRLEKGK